MQITNLKKYGYFCKVLKAAKWNGCLLSVKEASYIRPLSKKFKIRLEPSYTLKSGSNWWNPEYYKKPTDYMLSVGEDVKIWLVENYEKYSPFGAEMTAKRLDAIKNLPTKDGMLVGQLVFEEKL
jgi:hypothetical protein